MAEPQKLGATRITKDALSFLFKDCGRGCLESPFIRGDGKLKLKVDSFVISKTDESMMVILCWRSIPVAEVALPYHGVCEHRISGFDTTFDVTDYVL